MTDECGPADVVYFVGAAGGTTYVSGRICWRSEASAEGFARTRTEQDGHPRLVLGVPVISAKLIIKGEETRTLAGNNEEVQRGRGRPAKLTAEQIAAAAGLVAGGRTVAEVADELGVAAVTLRRHLAAARAAGSLP